MPFQILPVRLVGAAPLLTHNGQLANPLSAYAKALKTVSSKKNKTDADHAEMSRIEWFASLYVDQDKKVVLPDFLLEAAFQAGARKSKLGKQAQAGLFVDGHARLEFDGDDLDLEQLFERDQNRHMGLVRVQQNRVVRTRFIAPKWACNVNVAYNPELMNKAAVLKSVVDCGEQIGLGDWRPKHGRFEVQEIS